MRGEQRGVIGVTIVAGFAVVAAFFGSVTLGTAGGGALDDAMGNV